MRLKFCEARPLNDRAQFLESGPTSPSRPLAVGPTAEPSAWVHKTTVRGACPRIAHGDIEHIPLRPTTTLPKQARWPNTLSERGDPSFGINPSLPAKSSLEADLSLPHGCAETRTSWRLSTGGRFRLHFPGKEPGKELGGQSQAPPTVPAPDGGVRSPGLSNSVRFRFIRQFLQTVRPFES